MRTLEQKISDAGPYNQRIDPHLLTIARKELETSGQLSTIREHGTPWHHLTGHPPTEVAARLAEQASISRRIGRQQFTMRVGQALEIAVYRALRRQTHLEYFGAFIDLDGHDDATRYRKEEPPSNISGHRMPGDLSLDFLVYSPDGGFAGLEVKNIREWIYPDREEVTSLIHKCCAFDAVPVLICRRYAYSTYSVLSRCGVLLHQCYNQLYPSADAELAALARDKKMLGFHDIRLGNEPDRRLEKFIGQDLPALLPSARARFDEYKDLLCDYGSGSMGYDEFAGRALRRSRGENEDGDFDADDFADW